MKRAKKRTNPSLGYGFLFLKNLEGAIKLIIDWNGKIFKGRDLKVHWAQRNAKLLISI